MLNSRQNKSGRVEVRDIRRRSKAEIEWQKRAQKRSKSFRTTVILAILAVLALIISISVGLILGLR